MSIPIITLKDISLLDRICIVDDAPLEIPSILLEDFDIVKQETRGYVYTKPNVIEYYERMFPKMRVRDDEHFQESKLLDWLQKLRNEKYKYNKHVLVLDLCCTETQLSSSFIEKLVEVIHNFGEIIFMMTVPSSFEKHNLFHKFDRIILGQHIPSSAPLWVTLGDDVRKYYSNTARGHKFLTWNVKGGRYEMLDVNYQPPVFNSNSSSIASSNPATTTSISTSSTPANTTNTKPNPTTNSKSANTKSNSTTKSANTKPNPTKNSTSAASKSANISDTKPTSTKPTSTSKQEGGEYEARDDCIIL